MEILVMTKRNLILRAAVVAAFSIGSSAAFAAAAVSLSPTVASAPAKYATELLSANVTLTNAASAIDLAFNPAWGVAPSNHLYVRIDLTNGKFKTPLDAASLITSTGTATIALASGGGVASTYAIFDVSDTAGVLLTHTITLQPADLTLVDPSQVIAAKVNVYTDTAAASVGASGLGGSLSDSYVTKATAVSTTFTADTTTTLVSGQFKQFADSTNIAPGPVAGKIALLGKVQTAIKTVVLKPSSGVQVVAADFATASDLVLTGDFSGIGNPITGSVGMDSNANCATALGAGTINLAKTTATFTAYAGVTLVAAKPFLCYTVDGTVVLPAQTVTGTLTFTGQVAGAVTPVAANTVGIIVRDGSTMVAPLVQVPAGWISRLVLTNAGSVARDYTVRALSVDGVASTLSGVAAGGTLAANATTVIDMPTTVTTSSNKASLVVTVAAPLNTVDGLYQIVNPTSGSISNHVLSYK
jgi:hypothetical protein